MDEPDRQKNGNDIAEYEAENRLHERRPEIRPQDAGVFAEGLDDVDWSGRHERWHRKAPDDELPQQDAAKDRKRCRQMSQGSADGSVDRSEPVAVGQVAAIRW
ncbi:hypothetical protein D9M72_536560 [compost metagenome]